MLYLNVGLMLHLVISLLLLLLLLLLLNIIIIIVFLLILYFYSVKIILSNIIIGAKSFHFTKWYDYNCHGGLTL